MPSAKSSGKKGDKEKKRREAEERKRLAEEEERVRQEQEDRERRKREKTEAEERKKREKSEQKVRIVELAEMRAMIKGYHEARDAYYSGLRRDSRWRRYLRCDGSPDPIVLPEINTYMGEWRDDDKRVLIDDVLCESKPCLSLIQELENHLAEGAPTTEEARQYRDTVAALQDLLQQKLNRATYEMLRRGATLADSETTNLQTVWRNSTISLCLWGNLSKNPRIKTFEFADAGIGFDIPKALTKVGCAYQFLLTTFDHYSPQSASFYAVPVRKPEEAPPAPPAEEAAAAEGAEAPEGGDKEAEAPAEPVREPTIDLLAELHRVEGEEPEKEPEPEPEEELETPEEDLRVSPAPAEFEDFDGEEDAMDLRGYHTIGPVMQFNILQLPPQPLSKRGWTIVQHLTPPQPVTFDYKPQPIVRKDLEETHEGEGDVNSVTEGSNPTTVSNQLTQQAAAAAAASKKPVEIENPPITVSFKLPTNVFYAEEPKVARWDAERKEWRTDGIEVTKFDEEKRVLHFRTSVFGTLAFLQDFHINMPFQQWELRPLGTRSCRLNIVASINEVAIHVKEDQVCIPEAPADGANDGAEADPEVQLGRRELAHLQGKWMSVKSLIASLRTAGINLFPREDSAKHVDVPDKSSIAENQLYEQMALLSPAVAFAWSRWNSEVKDRESIILQACEHLEDCPVNEDDFQLFTVTRRHVRRLKVKEFAEQFSEDLDEELDFHADFYHAFQEFGSQAGKARVTDVDFQYLKTVTELLAATRMVIFS